MKRIYIFTFFVFVMVSMYIVFLILQDRYKDYQITTYIANLEKQTLTISERIQTKEHELAYTTTPSFVDQIAKSSQNLSNPWEQTFIIIRPEEDTRLKEPPVRVSGQGNDNNKNQVNTWKYYILQIKHIQK